MYKSQQESVSTVCYKKVLKINFKSEEQKINKKPKVFKIDKKNS